MHLFGKAIAFVPGLALLMAAGCSNSRALVERGVPHATNQFAREFLMHLQRGAVSAAAAQVDESSRGAGLESGLQEIAHVLNGRSPDSVRVMGFEAFLGKGMTRRNITYELTYPDGWVIAKIGVREHDSVRAITGARADGIPRQAAVENAFRIAGKSSLHLLVLAGAIAIPMFTVWTLVKVTRSGWRRKWLWAAVVLLAVGKFNLNWTTGQTWLQWAQIQLLGAGFFRNGGPYMPWILSIGVPLGAVLAQVKLRRGKATPPASPVAGDTSGVPASAT